MAEDLNQDLQVENPIDKIKKLYSTVSKDYDFGDFDTFSKKLQDPSSRQKFYDIVSKEFDLGNYNDFTKKVAITPEKKNLGFQDGALSFPITSVSPLQKGSKEALQEGAGLADNSFLKQISSPAPFKSLAPVEGDLLPSNYKSLGEVSLKEKKEPKSYYNAPLEKGVIFTGDTQMMAPGSKITEEDAKKLPLDVTIKNKFAQDYIDKIRKEPTNYEVDGAYFDFDMDPMGGIHFNIAQNAIDQFIVKAADIASGAATGIRDFQATSQGVQPTKISESSTWLNDPLGKIVLGLNGIRSDFEGDLQYHGKLPDTMFGKLVSGGIGIVPDIVGAALMPEVELFAGAGLLSKVGKFFTKKFPLYLGGTRAISEYGRERETGKTPEEAAGAALKGGVKGYAEGLVMELAGMGSSKATSAIMKPLEKMGLTNVKGQITKEGINTITDAIGYGALLPVASAVIEGKMPTEDEFIQGVGLSIPFSAMRIFKNAKTNAQLNDAIDQIEALQGGIKLSNFVDATTPSIIEVYKSKETAAELNLKSLQFAKKARETTDLNLKQDYIMQSSAAKKAANVKQIAETVIDDKNNFKEFRESNLPENIKQAFLDKAAQVYKELNPTEQQKTELGKRIIQSETFVDEMTKQMEAETDPVKKAELKYQIDETNKLLEKQNTDLTDIIAKQAKEREEYNKPEPEETVKKVRKPSQKKIQKDIDSGNMVSFTYANESEVPEPFKNKIVSTGETNGVKFVRVTVPKSVADYELSKIKTEPVEIITPKAAPKTTADLVADDVLAHLGITPEIEGKITPAKKYTSKNVDTISEEGLTDTQKKVVTDVKKVVKSVSKLVEKTTGKPLEVNIHETPDSYENAVKEAGGTKQDSTSKGFYLDSNGTIHLNMGKVTTDTMLHEGFHPVLDYMAKNRPDIINDLHAQLEGLTGGKDVIESANELYKDSDPTTIKKEAITDFIAKVADGTIKIDKTNFEKVKDFVINAINRLGFDIGKNIDNITDLKNLAELVSEKFNKGEEIYNGDFKQITKSEAQGDILGAGKVSDKNIDDSKVGDINPIQFSKDKFEEKELSKLPVKSLKDVLSEFDNKAVAINTDPTRVGKLTLPSGKEIFMYGGPNYSALKENVNNNIGFASTAIGKPKQVRGAINAMHENGKGLVLVTTQKPESMLGNAYALENTLDAITMLPKKILKSSEFKNEFFGKDIVAVKDAFGKHYDEFVKKYEKADFSSPEVLNNMVKDLLNDIGNNFNARNSLVDNLLAGIVEKSKRAATKDEPGYVSVAPNKFISKALFDYQGLNQEKLFYNIGEKGIIDAYMNEGKWGFITNGFTSDANIDHLSIQDKGIIHPQFNAKFHGENPFILDGAYMIDKLWTPKVMTENAKGEPYINKKTGEPAPFVLKSSQLVSQSMYPKGKVNEPNIKADVEKGVPQFSKENQDVKIKEFIDIQRKKGISDEDIKSGLEKVADKIGIDNKKINDLLSENIEKGKEIPEKLENKPRTLADEFADAEKRKSEKSIQNAKNKIIKDNFGKIVDELLNNKKIDRIC